MTSTFEQQCPLCYNNAEYVFRDHKNLKHFYCKKCKEFVISRSAEKHLLNGNPDWRIALSEKAKLTDEKNVFVIKTYDPARKSDGFGYLKIEFVDRKIARLW